MLIYRLGLVKISAGLLLLIGVILVCKPPFIFHEDGAQVIAPRVLDTVQDLKSFPAPQDADYPLYYLGLVLAVAGCVSGGAMNVLVARFIFTLINQYC